MDYDAIIIGAGPAGLSAGSLLARAKYRVLLLDKESFGGQLMNVEWIEGYPGPFDRISGAVLASEMLNEAEQSGAHLEMGEVVAVEFHAGFKSLRCADGTVYTPAVVVLASGLRPKQLGVPGEDRLQGKGVIHCALCDAGLYAGKIVTVCGGGDAGLIEAMYLSNFATKVFVIEVQPRLSATPALQERAYANAKLDIRCGEKIVEIAGEEYVTGVQVENAESGRREVLEAYGVLVRVGFRPAADYLHRLPFLDEPGYIVVNDQAETTNSGVFAAGDIRSGAPRRVAAAVSDGKTAAISALRLLERLKEEA